MSAAIRDWHNFVVFVLTACVIGGCATSDKSPTSSGNLDGLGPVHHPITTKGAAAQRSFDQGLARLYGFNHDAAKEAFQAAARQDPNCAMANWGIALVVGPNYNMPEIDAEAMRAACNAVEESTQRAEFASESERDYIAALAKRYSTDSNADLKKLQGDFAQAMGELSRKYPDDLDAATLYAESMMNLHPWKLWRSDGTPEVGTQQIVSTLEEAIENYEQAVMLQDKLQDKLVYDEPPPWPWPARETLGSALLTIRQPERAEKIFREDLRKHPNSPRSLLGLAQSLQDQGKSADSTLAHYQAASASADVQVAVSDF